MVRQDDDAKPTPGRARRACVAAACVASLLVAGACSGGGASTPDADASAQATGVATPDDSASTDASASPDSAAGPPGAADYLPVPDGVRLTPQGSLQALGTPATVAYRVGNKVAALRIRVDEIERTTFATSFDGWKLDARTRRSTPYFVRASVLNVGRTPLGGERVPLYLQDRSNTLVESSEFAGDFTPCPSEPLPRGFRNGARANVCLVFLAPPGGAVDGVTFRPTRRFDAIIWTDQTPLSGGQGGDRRTDRRTDRRENRGNDRRNHRGNDRGNGAATSGAQQGNGGGTRG